MIDELLDHEPLVSQLVGLEMRVARGGRESIHPAQRSRRSGQCCGGALGSAALDVYDPEPVRDARWADVPNTVLTPHLGGAGLGAWDTQIAMMRDNLDRFFGGRPLANPIPR